jgi:hypothetical protein
MLSLFSPRRAGEYGVELREHRFPEMLSLFSPRRAGEYGAEFLLGGVIRA